MQNFKTDEMLAYIVEVVESAENIERLEKNLIDYQITNGNQKQHILADLQRKYSESWDTMSIINLKIADKIKRKLSKVYSTGVDRVVIDKKTGEKIEDITKLVNYIYTDSTNNYDTFDIVMDKTNGYYTIHEYVEVFTYVDEEYRIRFKSLPQQLFTALPTKDKQRSKAIIFRHNKSEWSDYYNIIDWNMTYEELLNPEVMGVYTVWTKEENFTFAKVRGEMASDNRDEDNMIIFKYVITNNDDNPSGINPYGIYPFTTIKKSTDGHFYPFGSEIPEMSKQINIMLSNLVSIAEQQGFGQAVIYYDGDTPPAITKSSPTHVIAIPNASGKASFNYANANPDLVGHLNTILSITRMLLTTNDLTTDKISGELSATQFASAIDRLIADSEVIVNIEDQRKKYIEAEKNSFKILIALVKYLAEIKRLPDDYPKFKMTNLYNTDLDISIKFNTIKPITTEKEKAESISMLEEKGFILPWQKHIRFNERMSEQEAKLFEEEIIKAKKEKQDLFFKEQKDNANQALKDFQSQGDSGDGQEDDNNDEISQRQRQEATRQYNSRENKRENSRRHWRDSRRERVPAKQ